MKTFGKRERDGDANSFACIDAEARRTSLSSNP